MCGRFTLRNRLNDLLREFEAEIRGEPFDLFERYNICPTNKIPIIRETDGGREMVRMQWGFVPSWAKDFKLCPINAVSETVAEKPMFRSAIKKRRCLIPADGFYEWKKIPKKIKGDSPWLFQVKGGKPFAFAGIWERWESKPEQDQEKIVIESCAILTTKPNEVMAPIHDRLPVILSPADYKAWLDPTMNDPTKLGYLYEPFPSSEMTMTRVGPYVNKAGNEGDECVKAADPTLF
jgi:putative SOS response-associated peptidase YedK